MPISLSDFTIGEVGYVAKMNANNQAIRDYLVQTETAEANIQASSLSVSGMQRAMFGPTPAVIGESSYRTFAIGSDLMVSEGTAWAPGQNLIIQLLSGATVSMTGLPSGTYYLNAVNGTPLTQPVIGTTARDPLYSFEWNGSSITNLVRLASVIQSLPRGPEDVTFAASISLNWSRTETLRLRLTGNATITGCTGAVDGQRCMLEVTQDGTGGRTLTLGTSAIRVGTDVTWGVALEANRRTRIGLVFVRPTSHYDLAAIARGF